MLNRAVETARQDLEFIGGHDVILQYIHAVRCRFVINQAVIGCPSDLL